MDIKEAYEELKTIAPRKEHVATGYNMDRYSNGTEAIECSAYIESVGTFAADTFRMAIDEAKTALGVTKSEELDIEG